MEWISVQTICPEDYKSVLVWIQSEEKYEIAFRKKYSTKEEKHCYTGWYLEEFDWDEDFGKNQIKEKVTHWQALPDRP